MLRLRHYFHHRVERQRHFGSTAAPFSMKGRPIRSSTKEHLTKWLPMAPLTHPTSDPLR